MLGGSINVESLEFIGVRQSGALQGRLVRVSIEQVLRWDPDAIIVIDREFYGLAYGVTPGDAEIGRVLAGRG